MPPKLKPAPIIDKTSKISTPDRAKIIKISGKLPPGVAEAMLPMRRYLISGFIQYIEATLPATGEIRQLGKSLLVILNSIKKEANGNPTKR